MAGTGVALHLSSNFGHYFHIFSHKKILNRCIVSSPSKNVDFGRLDGVADPPRMRISWD